LYNNITGGNGKMDNEKSKMIVKSLELGFEIVISLLLFTLLGLDIDKKFDISPWGILGGVFFGIGSSFAILFKFGVSKK